MAMALRLGHFIESEGTDRPVRPFEIPLDGVTKAFAIVGIRDSGKSSLGTVMAEEYCKLKQPWLAFDPGGNWWGLRSKPDGSPGGFPVVVFGGEHGDLPLEKDSGRKIAEAIMRENVFVVIDLKMTSKTTWRILVRDIVRTLQEIQAEVPRMVFIEEGQEFLPQRPSHQLGAECKEIVERLVTLGGNWGYGATILGQRPASIEKSALSQCETVFAFATQGAHDRKALIDWMKSQEVGEDGKAALERLASLETGTCYVWSPRFLKTFAKLRIRRRETLHPREARKLGVSMGDVEMAPVQEFVARLSKQLTKTSVAVPLTTERFVKRVTKHLDYIEPKLDKIQAQAEEKNALIAQLEAANERLKLDLQTARAKASDAERRLAAVRASLQPQYDALRGLFEDLGQASLAGADRGLFEPMLQKAGQRGCRRMLELMIERRELTKTQLGTLAGVPSRKSTFRAYMAWLKHNGLVEVDGETVKLRAV
jgi:outer membrane murein-binding lipoprotein Lpp